MDQFMLIFRHEDGSKIASPEQMEIWMKQTMDWIGGIAAQNKYVGGNGLPMEGSKIVNHNSVVTNGPFGDIKETIVLRRNRRLADTAAYIGRRGRQICCF